MEHIEQFVAFLNLQKKLPSRLTVKNYKSDIRHFIRWFEKELQESFAPNSVTPQIINLYKKAEDISTRSMDRHVSSLRKFFYFAKVEGLIISNPFDQLNAKRYTLDASNDPWHLKDFKNFLYVYNASGITIKNYINDIQQFLSWLEQVTGIKDVGYVRRENVLDKIGRAVIEEYKHRLLKTGFSPRSINRKLSSLRKYLKWAEEEGLLDWPAKPTPSSTLAEEEIPSQYSKFPPIRLLQKTTKGINSAIDTIVIIPLAEAIGKIRGNNIFYNKSKAVKNFSKELYAPLAISTKYFPWHKKLLFTIRHALPKWRTHYIPFAILIVSASLLGIFLYQNLFEQPQKETILGVSNQLDSQQPLFFQGRLADKQNIPITKTTSVRFALYEDTNSPSPIWEEMQSITPDKDGFFEATLGSKEPITDRFFQNNLYLGIKIADGEELIPRELIPTTSYAKTAETIQGLPLITQSEISRNVVLALDSLGNLTIKKSASPTFQATDGNFTLSGQSLTLTTIAGSNNDVVIAPDGSGEIDLQKPIHNTSDNNNISGVTGAVEIADLLSVMATSSGQSAITINQNSTGPIVSASSSGTAKFTLDYDGTAYLAGNLGIGTKNPIAKLQVSGDIAPSENGIYNLGSPSLRFDTIYANTIAASSSGTLAYWQRTQGALSPTTITDALNLGDTATSSATVHLSGTDQNSFIRKGNFGIGTASPITKFHVEGTQYISGNLGIGTTSPNYKVDVTGSINTTGDIYKNGTAFNNPDYVFEKWVTGEIVKFAGSAGASGYPGILSLEDIESFVKQHFQLPRVSSVNGIFERGDILLEKVEEAYIHLFDLNRKISSLFDTLTTQKIISPIAQIDMVRTNVISPLSADSVVVKGKLDVQGSASISGVLRAKKIIADDIDLPASLREELQAGGNIGSDSAELAVDFGRFNQGLIALGPTSLTDTTIIGNLTVGQYLTIADTSLDVIGADLELQPLRQGGISFLSGLVQIDTEGNLVVLGNASFEKDVAIKGTLFIKKLNLDIPKAIAISDTEIQASGSAGIATISANRSTITINNPQVNEQSLIYITPREQTDNQVLYLLRQVPNTSFTVGLQKPPQKDVPFNWLIVN